MDAGGEGTPFILLEQAGSVVLGETLDRIKIMIFGIMNKSTISKIWEKKQTTARMEFNSTKKKKRLHLLYQEIMHGEMHLYTITSSTRRDKVKDKTNIRIGDK